MPVSNIIPNYFINQELRDLLIQRLGNLEKENVVLQQSLREQEMAHTANSEYLFLELLEVVDALTTLLDYLQNNPQPSQEFIERLPRSLAAVNRKFLSVLEKRQLIPIELVGIEPDFHLCRVVDREERTDVPDKTITKIVRRGFRWGEKILRPTEVITAKTKSSLDSNIPEQNQKTETLAISLSELFTTGVKACKQENYPKAIQYLEEYCNNCRQSNSKNYLQAKFCLIKAYQMSEQLEKAIALCQSLINHHHPQVNNWANKILATLSPENTSV